MLLVEVHLFCRHVCETVAVGGSADADVAIHLFHPASFDGSTQRHALGRGRAVKTPQDRVAFPADDRQPAAVSGQFDQGTDQGRVGQVECLDEDLVTGCHLAAVVQECPC